MTRIGERSVRDPMLLLAADFHEYGLLRLVRIDDGSYDRA